MSENIHISPRALWDRLHGRSDGRFFILDVRNEADAARWPVEGAREVPRFNIPYFSFIDDEEGALARVPTDLGQAVVVCAKAGSSDYVAEVLRGAGRDAVSVEGGMIGWGDLHVPLRIPLEGEEAERMELWQFNRYGKGCLSYAIVADGEAAIVDPSRFAGIYENFAGERGLRITEVLETHVHADHVSGGPALARRTGARYRVLNGNGPEPKVGVAVEPLPEGRSEIPLGRADGITIEVNALRTPGHTPGSVSYLVGGKYLLSGDTLFVRGVGRPDLGGQLEDWGRALHRTLRTVVSQLPDEVVVLPAHFSGAEEASREGIVRGRLGEIRTTAPEFGIDSAEAFVDALRAGMKEAPAIYAEIVKANLGLVDPGEAAGEWELGRNECAATARRKAQPAA